MSFSVMVKKLLSVSLFVIFQFHPVLGQKPGSLTAVDLDGTDDYVLVPDISALNPTSSITVEAWVKADVYATTNYGNSIFCKHGWASGNKGYVLRCGDNGKLNFNISNASGTWVEAFSASIMKTGVWYHVAGIFTGDSINVYINGKLEATTLYSGVMSPSSGLAAKIGELAYTAGGSRPFNGQIDEVRVWNTALSKATLRSWMCRKVTPLHPDYSNLAVYYKLDEGRGVDANDKSKNSNTGTLTNGPVWLNSGAVLGDSSVYIYGGSTMALPTKFGDRFTIRNIAGSPSMVHAIVTYDTSVQPIKLNTLGSIDSTHFFTVFYEDNSSVKFDINYNIKNLNSIKGIKKCGANMFVKPMGNVGVWDYAPARLYDAGDSLVIKNQIKNEFIMALYQTDSTKLLISPSGNNWFCAGDSVMLSAAGNDSFNYVWYKNGNLMNGKTKKSLWVNAVGNYRVKFTRRNTSCSFMSTAMNIGSKSTAVSWNFNLTVCENSDSVKLTQGNPAGGYFTGKWVTGNGYFHPKKAGAGNFTLYYNFIDTNQCVNRAPAAITLLDTIKLTSSPIDSACTGRGVIYLDNVKPGGGTYQGKGVTANTFSIAVAGAGNHAVTYMLTNSNTCRSKSVFKIKINKPDSISVTMKDKACNYDPSFTVHTYPVGGVLKGNAVVGQNFFPLFANIGWQWVYYSITDSHQCQLKDSAKIYISEVPVAQLLPFSSVCDNDKDFILKGGQPADSGKYRVDGILTDVFSPAAKGKGLFKIEYKVINYFGCRDSAKSQIRVNSSPIKPLINILKNTLTSSAVKGNQWYYKNKPLAGANQQDYNPAIDGYYFVKVTNDSNCSQTSDSVLFTRVGINIISGLNPLIYPNPSSDGIIYFEGIPFNSELKIFNPVGELLTDIKKLNSKGMIDLRAFGSGAYFIEIRNDRDWYTCRVMIF